MFLLRAIALKQGACAAASPPSFVLRRAPNPALLIMNLGKGTGAS